MNEVKDQNREPSYKTQKTINENDIKQVDQILTEEAPEFMNQVSSIKISAEGIDLSVMEKAFFEISKSKWDFILNIKKIFSYKANPKAFIVFWLTTITVSVVLYAVWSGLISFGSSKLFINSLAEIGESIKLSETKNQDDWESFYDNPRFSKNLMTLSKMFVNLKSSENSGPNPMLAFDVNVEGISADAIIELKDREAEFKDYLLRVVEDKTFDELNSTNGKQELCDQFRHMINTHLTRGQVRKVLINSFIIKP